MKKREVNDWFSSKLPYQYFVPVNSFFSRIGRRAVSSRINIAQNKKM